MMKNTHELLFAAATCDAFSKNASQVVALKTWKAISALHPLNGNGVKIDPGTQIYYYIQRMYNEM